MLPYITEEGSGNVRKFGVKWAGPRTKIDLASCN